MIQKSLIAPWQPPAPCHRADFTCYYLNFMNHSPSVWTPETPETKWIIIKMQLSWFVKDAVKRFFFLFLWTRFSQLSSICSHAYEENVNYSSNEQSLKNINQTAVCRQICIRNDIFQARRWEDVWWSNCVGKDSAEVGELQPVGKSLPAIYFCK